MVRLLSHGTRIASAFPAPITGCSHKNYVRLYDGMAVMRHIYLVNYPLYLLGTHADPDTETSNPKAVLFQELRARMKPNCLSVCFTSDVASSGLDQCSLWTLLNSHLHLSQPHFKVKLTRMK